MFQQISLGEIGFVARRESFLGMIDCLIRRIQLPDVTELQAKEVEYLRARLGELGVSKKKNFDLTADFEGLKDFRFWADNLLEFAKSHYSRETKIHMDIDLHVGLIHSAYAWSLLFEFADAQREMDGG